MSEQAKAMFCRPSDERALLAYGFRSLDNFYDLISKVDSKDFLDNDHRNIITVMSLLANGGVKAFDLPMMLDLAGQLEVKFDLNYLHSIKDMAVSEANFAIYSQNVLEASTKYTLYSHLHSHLKVLEDNSQQGIDSAELIGRVENAILDLSTASKAIREPINMCEGLREELIERMNHPVETLGISTGFTCLNKYIDGLVPGTLNVVAARPKMGKSTFLSAIARHVAFQEGVPTLYIDTEMGFKQWRDRQVAAMSNMEERLIKHGKYDKAQFEEIIKKCVDIVEKRKLYHEYMPGYTVDKIVALYKKYKMKHNIGLMVFDYIKEPDSSSIERQRKEYQILGDVTTKLKDLAGELEIPCLTAVQINREGTVADSDRIARYADIIMEWMFRTEDELDAHADGKAGQYKLVIRETRRGGSTGEKGIGYHFFRKKLIVREADLDFQIIPTDDGDYDNVPGSNDEIT